MSPGTREAARTRTISSVANDGGFARHAAAERLDRLKRLVLLHEAEHRIDENDTEDHRAIDPLTEEGGRDRRREHDVDEWRVELHGEPEQRSWTALACEHVRTETALPCFDFDRTKAELHVRVENLEHGFAVEVVPLAFEEGVHRARHRKLRASESRSRPSLDPACALRGVRARRERCANSRLCTPRLARQLPPRRVDCEIDGPLARRLRLEIDRHEDLGRAWAPSGTRSAHRPKRRLFLPNFKVYGALKPFASPNRRLARGPSADSDEARVSRTPNRLNPVCFHRLLTGSRRCSSSRTSSRAGGLASSRCPGIYSGGSNQTKPHETRSRAGSTRTTNFPLEDEFPSPPIGTQMTRKSCLTSHWHGGDSSLSEARDRARAI